MKRKEFNKGIVIASREIAAYALLTFRNNLIKAHGIITKMEQGSQTITIGNLNDVDQLTDILINDTKYDIDIQVKAYIHKETCLVHEFSEWVQVYVVNDQGDWVWEEDSIVNFDDDFVKMLKEQYKRFPDSQDFEELQETYDRTMDDTKRLIARMVNILAYGDNPKALVNTIKLTEPVYVGDTTFSVIQTQLLSENRFTLHDKPFGDVYYGSNDINDMGILQKIASDLMEQAKKLCIH